MFGSAELMLGANHIKVRCFDGVTRIGRIKGKIKKKVWIREGDILIVVPWSFQDEKCDIIYRYTRPQVEWLRRNRYSDILIGVSDRLPGRVLGSKKVRCRGSRSYTLL